MSFIKQYFINRKRKHLQNQVVLLYNLTTKIENLLDKLQVTREARRQFWHDFFRDRNFRKDIFEKLFAEILQEVSK